MRTFIMLAEAVYILACVPTMKRKQQSAFARWPFVRWSPKAAIVWAALALLQLTHHRLVMVGMFAVALVFFVSSVRPGTHFARYGMWCVALTCITLIHTLEYGWFLRGESGLVLPTVLFTGAGLLLVRGHIRAGTPMSQIIAERATTTPDHD